MKCTNCGEELGLFRVTIKGEQFCSNKCLLEKHPEYSRNEMERVQDLKNKFEKEIDDKREQNI